MKAGSVDRRPGRRERRQLRADRARPDRRQARRHDRLAAEPARRTMPEHASQLYARNVQELLEPDRQGRRGRRGAVDRARLRRRDRRRRVRHARRRDRPRGRQGRGRPAALGETTMFVTNLAILVLAGFVGYAVISKVPNTLHTPLMSGTNAIHGIVVLGGILVLGLERGPRRVQQGRCSSSRSSSARSTSSAASSSPTGCSRCSRASPRRRRRLRGAQVIAPPLASFLQDDDFIDILYIVAFSLFIYGLSRADGPAHGGARQPHRRGRHGRRAASRRSCYEGIGNWGLIVVRPGRRHDRSASPRRAR